MRASHGRVVNTYENLKGHPESWNGCRCELNESINSKSCFTAGPREELRARIVAGNRNDDWCRTTYVDDVLQRTVTFGHEGLCAVKSAAGPWCGGRRQANEAAGIQPA